MAIKDLHLAELHERARALDVPGYRMLERRDLIAAIEERGGEGEDAPKEAPADEGAPEEAAAKEESAARRPAAKPRERKPRQRKPRGGGGRRPRERSDADEEEVETEEVTGVLDRMPQGYGFLRLGGLEPADGDVYVSASQIRRCELRPGDEVTGPARAPRRGERHRALVQVASVNGQEPEGERTVFEDLTPATPKRRLLPLDAEGDPLVRAVDLLTPLAFGQRVLILAQPRSGRTTLLRAIGGIVTAAKARLVVLLADERPEEVPEWERAVPDAEIFAATADQEPREQVRAAELAMGHAKRRAETGEDVVVIIDSLSRLARGYRDASRVKRLFGAGRELTEEGAGSLTVIATVLEEDDRGDEVRSAVETTENVLLRLDADLAAQGIVPSLVVADCRVSGEEELRSPEELEAVRALRSELGEMEPADAARTLGERIEGSKKNAELLG